MWRETEVRMCVERDRGEITERSFIHDLPILRNVSILLQNRYGIHIHTYKRSLISLHKVGREVVGVKGRLQ